MSHPVFSRPLFFLSFFVADVVLLLTAFLIAWRTTDDLSGGALAGVVVCTCLGAVLTVLPFILNDAREREALLVKRQGELAELVNSSLATTSRWGAQWAAAATGLEDAAGLASRNIAAAERLPAVFQEKIDSFAAVFSAAEYAAQARDERCAKAHEERIAQQEQILADRIKAAAAVAVELARMLGEFTQVEHTLRERQASLDATLAAFPAAEARLQTARESLEERVVAVPAEIVAQHERMSDEADARLNATADALAQRLAAMETAITSLLAQMEHLQAVAITCPPPAAVAAPEPRPQAASSISEDVVVPAPRVEPVLAVTVTPPPAAAPSVPIPPPCNEAIMDPFFIPEDGYSALADAMDAGRPASAV